MCHFCSFARALPARRYFACVRFLAAMLLAAGWTLPASAQHQVHTASPFQTNSNGYSEGIGIGWGLRGPGFFFNMNNPALPPFGGYQPGTGANFGFGFGRGGTSGFFNLNASQGSSSASSMVSSSVTGMNGMPATMSAGSITPFVVGVTPVVRNAPMGPMPGPAFITPLQERLSRINEAGGNADVPRQAAQANAGAPPPPVAQPTARGVDVAGALSLDEIKALRAQQDQAADAELQAIVAKARAARDADKPAVARIYYQQAVRRASGATRTALEAEMAN